MKYLNTLFIGTGCLLLLSGCTDRRRATPPVPDGDTIEVVIDDGETTPDSMPKIRIIEVNDPADSIPS